MRKPQLLSKILVVGTMLLASLTYANASAIEPPEVQNPNDDGKYRFGVGVSVVSPPGGQVGFGPFFTAERNLTDKQMLRGALGYVHFSGVKDGFGTWEKMQFKNRFSAEANWLYSLGSNGRGLYVLGGVGTMNNSWMSTRPDQGGNLYSSSHSNLATALVVGAGFRFRGYEIEYKRFVYPPGQKNPPGLKNFGHIPISELHFGTR